MIIINIGCSLSFFNTILFKHPWIDEKDNLEGLTYFLPLNIFVRHTIAHSKKS